MSLPASLVDQIEKHPCFPGVWQSEADVQVCVDPLAGLQRARVISCSECYAKLAALETLLPGGMNATTLARDLTQHMRSLRGYTLSIGGYHTRGPGFWISVVYFGTTGLFLIDSARSRQLGTDLDLLLLAFQQGVLQTFSPLLLDRAQYRTQTVYVNFATPPGTIRNKQDLLAWTGCRLQAAQSYHAVTLAEFLPVAGPTPPPTATATLRPPTARLSATAPAKPVAAPAPPKIGDICPKCKAEFRHRPLLNGTYLGCMC